MKNKQIINAGMILLVLGFFLSINVASASDVNTTIFQNDEGNKLNFSAEALTCTNISNVERVIDLRLTSFDVKNNSISIPSLNTTIDLLPGQIKRIEISIPYGFSSLKLVSGDGEELKLQFPPCVNGYEGGSDSFATSTILPTSTSTPTQTPTPAPTTGIDEIPEFPSIALPFAAIIAMLFLIGRHKK